jgi:hypothetical protein
LHRYIQQYPRPLEAFCHAWVDVMAAMRQFMADYPDNTIAVRYEDLVTNPEGEMRRLLEFVGEPWDPELLLRALSQKESKGFSDWKTFSRAQIDTSSIGHWRQLSPSTLADLAPLLNPTLVRCGYDAIEIDRSSSDAAVRRRYELGLLFHAMKSNKSEA